MRLSILLIICFNAFWSTAQSKKLKEQLCSHAWIQRPGNVIWNFHENGEIVGMAITVNKDISIKNIAITKTEYIKGTFSVDDSTGKVNVNIDSSYRVFSKDSALISTDVGTQEWRLITTEKYKIVFSRPPIWDLEKEIIANNEKTMLVTLTGGRKSWW